VLELVEEVDWARRWFKPLYGSGPVDSGPVKKQLENPRGDYSRGFSFTSSTVHRPLFKPLQTNTPPQLECSPEAIHAHGAAGADARVFAEHFRHQLEKPLMTCG